jgi:hypothetical protein
VRPWQKAALRCVALAPERAPRPPRIVREREARAIVRALEAERDRDARQLELAEAGE